MWGPNNLLITLLCIAFQPYTRSPEILSLQYRSYASVDNLTFVFTINWLSSGCQETQKEMAVFWITFTKICGDRSRWPRIPRHGSAAARLLGLRVRIMLGAWMSVCCECCVLSGIGLYDGLITRPEESYWCNVSEQPHIYNLSLLRLLFQKIVCDLYVYCYVYIFSLLCMFWYVRSVFIVPIGTLRLP